MIPAPKMRQKADEYRLERISALVPESTIKFVQEEIEKSAKLGKYRVVIGFERLGYNPTFSSWHIISLEQLLKSCEYTVEVTECQITVIWY